MRESADLLIELVKLAATPVFAGETALAVFVVFYLWRRTLWRAIMLALSFPGFIGFISFSVWFNFLRIHISSISVVNFVMSIYFCTFVFPFVFGFLAFCKYLIDAIDNKIDLKQECITFLFIFSLMFFNIFSFYMNLYRENTD